MDRKLIVFDFDKTLTYKDTLLLFYYSCTEKNLLLPFKMLFYHILMIFFKIGIISNDSLKDYGFNLFLRKSKIDTLELISEKYANTLIFNRLFHSFNFNSTEVRIIIVSASYHLYLKYVFPENVEIVATKIKCINGFADEIIYNCYSEKKRALLNDIGINVIDTFYTDSYSDRCLAEISREIYVVNKDDCIRCDNIDKFDLYFKK